MNSEFITRNIEKKDIPLLKDFAPASWNFAYDEFLNVHHGKKYFDSILTTKNDKIIATANAIINGNVGWAANIIVAPEYQGQGLGYKITEDILELMKQKVETLSLIATKEGEGLYKKFGFEIMEEYCFFEYKLIEHQKSNNIISFEEKYLDQFLSLDHECTQENRKELFKGYMKGCWLYLNEGKVEGYYLEGFGDGTVIAINEMTGAELLKFKHSRGRYRTVCPASNKKAIEILKSMGLKQKSTANRMILGKAINWEPQCSYCRLAGYGS